MSELNDILAEIVKIQASQGPLPSRQRTNQITGDLLNPGIVEPFSSATVEKEDPRGPSFINRVIDILSRPLYSVSNLVTEYGANVTGEFLESESGQKLDREGYSAYTDPEVLKDIAGLAARQASPLADTGDKLSAIWGGFSGKDKSTGRDVIDTAEELNEGPIFPDTTLGNVSRGVTSFATDVALDPLTYIGGIGLASKIGRPAAKSVEALGEIERASGESATSLAREISDLAAQSARSTPNVAPTGKPPRPEIPSMYQAQEPPRVFEAGSTRDFSLPALPPGERVDISGTLRASSSEGRNWEKLVRNQISEIPKGASRQVILDTLRAQLNVTKNPVTRNMINKQIKKLEEGVTPAPAVAANIPLKEFPDVKLSQKRFEQAQEIGRNFLRDNTFEEINPIGQSRLFERVQSWALKNVPPKARPSTILHMLRVAENTVLEAGRKLVNKEGLSTRLSDIGNTVGKVDSEVTDKFRRGTPLQATEDVTTATAAKTAEEVIDPIVEGAKKVREQTEAFPPSRILELGNPLARELEKIAKDAGASAAEASKAKSFVKELFDPAKDSDYPELARTARDMVRQSMEGKVDAHLIHKLNNKVYDALQANPKAFNNSIGATKTVEAIMTRLATAWGAKDLRPFAREYIDTARNVSAQMRHSLAPITRRSTTSERVRAWSVAQGKMQPLNDKEAQLAEEFRNIVDRLIGSHNLQIGESVVGRGGITLKELNKELPEHLQFTDRVIYDKLGQVQDYTGNKWVKSWREWETKEPTELIYELTRALQFITRKNSMLDDAAARWAMPIKGGEYQHKVNIKRLDGFYFPKPIAQQLEATWHRLNSDKFIQGPKFMQLIDKIQRMWKTGVTIYSPSHHIRNMNGDIFLGALDGVVTATPYLKSFSVLRARGPQKAMESVYNIMDPKLRDRALRAKPGSIVVTTKAGHKLTAKQVYEAAESQGFLLRAAILEDLITDAPSTFGPRFAPLGGRAHGFAAGASELRDHYVRLAHFIDVLSKSKTRNLRDAIEIAGRRVKKFHPDGSDLTGFEQTFLRRLLPFYSWLRKSTPLVIEGAAMRPHVSLLFPKAMANVQEVTGIESEGPGNPFPDDQIFPEWIKEKGIGPTFAPDSPLAGIGRQQTWRGDAPGYTIVNPTSPFMDQISEIGNPQKSALSSLTPFLRIPGEYLTGHTALGIPIKEVEGGAAGHALSQVPPVGIAARVTGQTRPDEPWHPEQLLNWLISGGLFRGTGPYKSQGRFEVQELLQQLGEQNREARK